MGQFISFKSEINNPWFNPWFILLHTYSNVCATVEGRCLEYLVCITLTHWPIFTYLLKSSLDQRWKQCYCRWSHWGWPRGASGRGQGGRSGKNVYRHNGGRFGHWATLWQTWSNDWCRHTSGCHHWFNQALWPEFSKFCSKIIDWTSANIWSSYIYQKTCKLLLLE